MLSRVATANLSHQSPSTMSQQSTIDRSSSSKPPPLCRHDYSTCPHIRHKLPSDKGLSDSEYRKAVRSSGKLLDVVFRAHELTGRYSQTVWRGRQMGRDSRDSWTQTAASESTLQISGQSSQRFRKLMIGRCSHLWHLQRCPNTSTRMPDLSLHRM